MKVIMPMAGKGTRLLPLTKRVPKPLVNVAGRPVMDYVMEALKRAGTLDELIIITGHLKEKVEQYVRSHYDIPARFVEQKVLDGTAGAVNLARPYVDGPVIVIFVDTLFDADLSIVKKVDADGIIWTKEVEDYQRFGVVVTDKQGYMTKIVEKPSTPISRRANIGLQYVKDWRTLFDGIDHVMKSPRERVGSSTSPTRSSTWSTRGRSSMSARSAVGTIAARSTRCSKPTSICSSMAELGALPRFRRE